MLFLLRPRQTWMPYSLPRDPNQMAEWNQLSRDAYGATRRVAPAAGDPLAEVRELAELHRSGALTDHEFAAAKKKVLGLDDAAS